MFNLYRVCDERVGHPIRVCTGDRKSGVYRVGFAYCWSRYLLECMRWCRPITAAEAGALSIEVPVGSLWVLTQMGATVS